MRIKKSNLFLLILSLLLTGCSLNYDEGKIADTLKEDIPDTDFTNFKQVHVNSDQSSTHLIARRSSNFDTRKEIIFLGFSYFELSPENEKTSEGQAGKVRYETETENADLDGNIKLVSYEKDNEGTLEGNFFHWDKTTEKLTGRPQDEALISREDGTYVQGKAFTADLGASSIHFQKNVKGVVIEKDEGETKDKDEATQKTETTS